MYKSTEREPHTVLWRFAACAVVASAWLAGSMAAETQETAPPPEEYFVHANQGRLLFETSKHEKCIEEFRKCVELAPGVPEAHINLAIAYLGGHREEEAIRELLAVRAAGRKFPHVHYCLGLAYKRTQKFDKAITEFGKVLEIDPACAGAHFNLGAIYKWQGKKADAVRKFQDTVKVNPDHSDAYYHLMRYALLAGKSEEARKYMKQFERVRILVPGEKRSAEAAESDKYSEFAEIRLAGDRDPRAADAKKEVRFVAAMGATKIGFRHAGPRAWPQTKKYQASSALAALASCLGSGAACGDVDGDQNVDLYFANASKRSAFYLATGMGTFTDAAAKSGASCGGAMLDAVMGDYDNDKDLDVLVCRNGTNVLYQNDGKGKFKDVTRQVGLRDDSFTMTGLFLDCDHDRDLDILLVNYLAPPKGTEVTFPDDFVGQRNVLYRNNGDGTFVDATVAAGLADDHGKSRDAVFADFDNDDDVDLYVVDDGTPNILYLNARGGRFVKAAKDAAPHAASVAAAVADYNFDGRMDLCVAGRVARDTRLYRNVGGAELREDMAFTSLLKFDESEVGVEVGFFDYDNDGNADLLLVHGRPQEGKFRGSLFRNRGDGRFVDATSATGLDGLLLAQPRKLVFADYDNDCDTDVLITNNGDAPALLRNDGGDQNNYLKISFEGRRSNILGVGVKVEIRNGRYYRKHEVVEAPILIGLGARDKIQVVRFSWPSGVMQSEVAVDANQVCPMVEDTRLPSSCPFLYVWDGNHFTFLTDILGAAPLGFLTDQGTCAVPNPHDYARIGSGVLRAPDGGYPLRLTTELQEITYLDELELVAVDHPSDMVVYADEKFCPPPFPKQTIHALQGLAPPVSAVDSEGQDVLATLSEIDRRYTAPFKVSDCEGYASEHFVELGLGEAPRSQEAVAVLLLTGWVHWTTSTSSREASQNPALSLRPPSVQVPDRDGRWQTVIADAGCPSGHDRTMLIDLAGKFLCADRRVRIVTNMQLYWNRILVGTKVKEEVLRSVRLRPATAALRWRGYSKKCSPDGKAPHLYDYSSVAPSQDWRTHRGLFTRYGDVQPLLLAADNRYIVMNHGDEVQITFDVTALPKVPGGRSRTVFLHSVGWIKDLDVNTLCSATVEPLPFLGMSRYPYPRSESFPNGTEHLRYLRTYNTRLGWPVDAH